MHTFSFLEQLNRNTMPLKIIVPHKIFNTQQADQPQSVAIYIFSKAT